MYIAILLPTKTDSRVVKMLEIVLKLSTLIKIHYPIWGQHCIWGKLGKLLATFFNAFHEHFLMKCIFIVPRSQHTLITSN